ncbi:MAG TPA: gephyrin-like molybdotransferase Glp [Burkholderiales bacterium]
MSEATAPVGRLRPDRLSVEEARTRVLAEVTAVSATERLALRSALRRVLAEDVISPIDVPSHTNAALDGYAVAGAELPAHGKKEFRIVGTAWAGRPYEGTVPPGGCVQIMTGAPMPAGTDTVVAAENVQAEEGRAVVDCDRHDARNVRRAGEDIARGQVALRRGKRLGPAELGMLASLGLGEVAVYRRPRVAFFSTGDELRSLGEPLAPGQIYDSNRYTLYAMLTELGVELLDMGVVRDRREDVRRALIEAAASADAIITTGGVSVGEADHIKEILGALGRISFWQVAMRPGRPLAFGRIDRASFFGLPGNPVAVMVTFYQFVQPALRRMMGEARPVLVPTLRARCLSPLKTRVGRTEFIRGILSRDEHGEWVVRTTGNQGSGILSSMSIGNCFIVLPPESESTEPGAIVEVQPFHGLC